MIPRAALADGVRLFFGLEVEKAFWGEHWTDVGVVLSGMADRLRRRRSVKHLELDSGWWEDRDLTIVNRLWLRLDVRGLVEDHGRGRCLCRVRMRSPLAAWVASLAIGGLGVVFARAAGFTGWPLGVIVTVLASVTVVGALTVTSSIVASVADTVAAELGMIAISSGSRNSPPESAAAPASAPSRRPDPEVAVSTLAPSESGAAADEPAERGRVSRALAGKA